ncbi:MAG: ASCH domain-containing protein [Pseudomonadota bacterium]
MRDGEEEAAMRLEELTDGTASLWRSFMALPETPVDARFYDVMRVGETAMAADEGAALILSGAKTATSSLMEEFMPEIGPPPIGSYSIVLDGGGAAVCLVRTRALMLVRFCDCDEGLALAYGEWDGTLETWQRECGAYYAARAAAFGLDWDERRELVIEHFQVVHRAEWLVNPTAH